MTDFVSFFGGESQKIADFGTIGNGNQDQRPPQRDGAWSALFSNPSKSSLDNYVVKRPLLEEVAWSRLLCHIEQIVKKCASIFLMQENGHFYKYGQYTTN